MSTDESLVTSLIFDSANSHVLGGGLDPSFEFQDGKSKKFLQSTSACSTNDGAASSVSFAAAPSLSSSPTQIRDIKKGCVDSKKQDIWCKNCNALTPQIVCTHWVNCNDYTKPKKTEKYLICTCLVCYTEYSGCRECNKKKDPADPCVTPMYEWTKDESKVTKFSLTCEVDGCKQKYIRCNYCKALYKKYSKCQDRTKKNCLYLQAIRMSRSSRKHSFTRKTKLSDRERSASLCGRSSKLACTGYGPESDPTCTVAVDSTAAASPTKPHMDAHVAINLKLEADKLDALAVEMGVEANEFKLKAKEFKLKAEMRENRRDQLKKQAERLRNLIQCEVKAPE